MVVLRFRQVWFAALVVAAAAPLAVGQEIPSFEPETPRAFAFTRNYQASYTYSDPLPGKPAAGAATSAAEGPLGPAASELPSGHDRCASCVPRQRSCGGQGCGQCGECYRSCGVGEGLLDNACLFSALDAFKGPLDLDGLNGNFGLRLGAQSGIPVWRDGGLGLQLGSSYSWNDFQGTQFTGAGDRNQSFTTIGLFQRSADQTLAWGCAYDKLLDDYYADLDFGQWRLKAAWQCNCTNELGLWVALPEHGDQAFIGNPQVLNHFDPIHQGNFYWKHFWQQGTVTQAWWGLAEQTGQFVYGASATVPLTDAISLDALVQYIDPSASAGPGREEESWNVTFGMSIYPGTARRTLRNRFAPLLPMADNANFSIMRHE